MKTVDDRLKLLFGPYRAPALRKGARATCLVRDCDVIITTWTDAPISWPRCVRADPPRNGNSLLVDEELARAVRQESCAAVGYWWGVSQTVVLRWRRVLGADRKNNPGTQRLIRVAVHKASARQRAVRGSAEWVERHRRTSSTRNAEHGTRPLYSGASWTDEELALLGTMPDDKLGKRLGRTALAVETKRNLQHIPIFRDHRRKGE